MTVCIFHDTCTTRANLWVKCFALYLSQAISFDIYSAFPQHTIQLMQALTECDLVYLYILQRASRAHIYERTHLCTIFQTIHTSNIHTSAINPICPAACAHRRCGIIRGHMQRKSGREHHSARRFFPYFNGRPIGNKIQLRLLQFWFNCKRATPIEPGQFEMTIIGAHTHASSAASGLLNI
jgi:hypothetical protein